MYNGDNVLLHYSIRADGDLKRSALYRPFGPTIDPRRELQPSARRSAHIDRVGVVAAARRILHPVMHLRALGRPAPVPCC